MILKMGNLKKTLLRKDQKLNFVFVFIVHLYLVIILQVGKVKEKMVNNIIVAINYIKELS